MGATRGRGGLTGGCSGSEGVGAGGSVTGGVPPKVANRRFTVVKASFNWRLTSERPSTNSWDGPAACARAFNSANFSTSSLLIITATFVLL